MNLSKINLANLTRERNPIRSHTKIDDAVSFGRGIHTIKGRSAVGKTALALQIAQESDRKIPVFYLNTEMQEASLMARFVAYQNNVSLNEIGRMMSDPNANGLQGLVDNVSINLSHFNIISGLNGFVTVEYLRDFIKSTSTSEKFILIIDSFDAWLDTSKQNWETLIINFLEFLDSTDGTIIICKQIIGDERDKAVQNKLSHSSESVMELSFERDGNMDRNGIRSSRITFEKIRGGIPVDTLLLNFNGAVQKFSDI